MTCVTEAKVLRYSVGADAPPLVSFQLRYPLQIHAELMTHRMFSRNARSSRAVPTARMIEEVRSAPFIPRYWGANQKGMQAGAELNAGVQLLDFLNASRLDETTHHWRLPQYTGTAEDAWLAARDYAAQAAEWFAKAGYHKQIANRLLAPFLHIDVVLTTVDLVNWDALRDHDMAEPHIRDLARAMKAALAAYGPPDHLQDGIWHLPYITDEEIAVHAQKPAFDKVEPALGAMDWKIFRKLSVTRCAQVSYTPFHEAKLSIAEEVARHDALISSRPCHASPCEHQASPDRIIGQDEKGEPIWANPHLHGNLPGWIQYRKTLPGERA